MFLHRYVHALVCSGGLDGAVKKFTKNSETLLAGCSVTVNGCATLDGNVLTDWKQKYKKNKLAAK